MPQPAVTPPAEHSTVADVVKAKKPVWCWKCANDTHISKECKVQHYCYICDKLAHPTVRCPVLKNPRPTAFVAGVGTYETFFTTLPDSVVKDDLTPNASPVARVVVTGDLVPSDMIQKQMARRCPAKAKWKWEAIPNGDNEFLISFPSFHDLDVVDGIQVAVPGFNSQMSVTAWKPTDIPHKFELEQVWLHVEGVPHNVRHFWGLWAVGSLMGKTLDVDLISLRRRGVVRVLVGMFDTTKFAKMLDKDGACVKSDVVLKLKGYEFRFRREPTDYIPESDFVPFVWKKKDGDGDGDEGKGKEQEDLMDTSEFGQGTVNVQTMNQTHGSSSSAAAPPGTSQVTSILHAVTPYNSDPKTPRGIAIVAALRKSHPSLERPSSTVGTPERSLTTPTATTVVASSKVVAPEELRVALSSATSSLTLQHGQVTAESSDAPAGFHGPPQSVPSFARGRRNMLGRTRPASQCAPSAEPGDGQHVEAAAGGTATAGAAHSEALAPMGPGAAGGSKSGGGAVPGSGASIAAASAPVSSPPRASSPLRASSPRSPAVTAGRVSTPASPSPVVTPLRQALTTPSRRSMRQVTSSDGAAPFGRGFPFQGHEAQGGF